MLVGAGVAPETTGQKSVFRFHCIVAVQENKPTQAATLREWTRGHEKTKHVQCSHTGLYTAWVGISSAISVAVEENGMGWPVLISGSDSSLYRFVGR